MITLPTDIQRLQKILPTRWHYPQVQHQMILHIKMFSPENCNNLEGYVAGMGRVGIGLGNRYENVVTWRRFRRGG